MKRFVTYLFAVTFSILIFYGGSGVNFMNFCCGACEEEGMEALLDNACCDIHGHTHAEGYNHDHGCGMERISFEWDFAHEMSQDLHPMVVDLFFSSTPDMSIVPTWGSNNQMAILSTGPPEVSPRDYLSFLTILLI